MLDYLHNSIFFRLTSSPESDTLGTWLRDDIDTFRSSRLEELQKEISNCSQEYIQSVLLICDYLAKYLYPELKIADETQKPLFALAMAHAGLFARIRSATKNAGLISALAVLLGTNYELNLDDSTLLADIPTLYGDYKISPPKSGWINPNERFMICPNISKLSLVSNASRRMFINLAYYAHHDRTIWTNSEELDIDNTIKSCIYELCSIGLLNANPDSSAKLTRCSNEQLSKFASEVGIKYLPKRKGDMVNAILAQCPIDILDQLIKKWENGVDPLHYNHGIKHDFYFCVPNDKGLYAFLHQEYDRLYAYLNFIANFPHSSNISSVPKSVEVIQDSLPTLSNYLKNPSDTCLKADFPTAFDGDSRRLRPSDLAAIKHYWDENCQAILEEVIHSYSTPEIVKVKSLEGVIQHFESIGVFKEYQLTTQKEGYDHNWRVVLSVFIDEKLKNNEYYRLTPKKIICPGCDVVFSEWSVPLRYAMLVEMNVQFCTGCYSYIFDHYRKATNTFTESLTNKEVLERLFRLSEALEMIPTKTYLDPTTKFNHLPIHLPSFPNEKQTAVGTAIINMPSYQIYIKRFGNWMEALVQSGVLADGHQVMSRGIRCIAKDGHVCLSLGEKTIDDWLTSRGISHEKEVPYPYDPTCNPNNQSRMDWKVGEVYIEYAGMMIEPDYRKKMDWKINLSAQKNHQLIILEPEDLEYLEKKLGFFIHSTK